MNSIRFLRKGLILLFLLAINFSQAQTVNTTFRTEINAKLAGLDKTKVPHKLLINQAMEFAELTDYSGTLTSTNFTTRGKFTNIYNTLLMSRVQAAVPGLVSPTTFKTNWDNLRQPNTIVLSGLYYKYNKFRSDAYPNYLVNNNGVVTDKYVGGVWQNPYAEQQVFAISAPILLYKSLSLKVTLPASLWYTNQSSSVQSIQIDFGNGAGYQTMALGQMRTINYSNAGTFEWKYKLTLTNGQILNSHSKLKIDIPTLAAPPTDPNNQTFNRAAPVDPPPVNCAAVVTMPFTGTKLYQGSANTATLQINYLNNDCAIRKPLIVVEGFDSGLLGVENPFGENSYNDFIQSTYSSFNLYYQVINYDIIYVNFNNGRDDLRRNAYLIEDIIAWVNAQKAIAGSTTPNVVIGQSMGGVIARYALRHMEVQGQIHQTSLFVSHDAPQQGANIPLGVQYFARHLADQFIDTPVGDYPVNLDGGTSISISDIQGLLNATGTKQLLANSIDTSFNLNNTIFNTFQTELRNLGYPTQTRNIALSNGNHCALPQEFNPSAPLFNLYGNASTTALTTILSTLLQPLTNIAFIYLAFELNEPGLLIGILPGSSSFNMNFNAWALPTAGTTNQIYSGSISYTKKLFSLFGWDPQITVYITDRSYNNPVSLSYDYYPGGKYQLPFNFSSTTVNNDWINLGISVSLAPAFNFIPVTSALDIGGGSTPLNNLDYLTAYNAATPPPAPKNSPFVNFTTSLPNGTNTNEQHISFNQRNGNWLATELDTNQNNNQIFDCTFICPSATITGADSICTSSAYSVGIGGTSYNWILTENDYLVTMTGNGTPTITLTNANNGNGYVTVQVTYGNATCGNTTITKRVYVGTPEFKEWYFFGYPTITQCIAPIDYLVADLPSLKVKAIFNGMTSAEILDNSNWEWSTENNLIMLNGTNNTRSICPMDVGFSSFSVRAKNACGWGEWYQIPQFEITMPQNNFKESSNIYTVYPNPSNDVITIDLRDENKQPERNATISGELFDMLGLSKSNVKISNNKATFSVRGLNKGIYVLKIYINDRIESHQIAVE